MWGLSYFKTPYNSHMGKQIENERLLLGRRIRSLRNIKGWTQEELVLTCIINSYMICFGVGGKNYAQRISHSTVF